MKKKRKRSCPIWLLPRDKFIELIKNSSSISAAIRYFGFTNLSGYHKIIKKRCEEENIDYSHIKMGKNSNRGRKFPSKSKPLEEVMVKNSTYCRGTLKKRLLKSNILKEECTNCGMLPVWDNKKLVLILDHINGVNNDHRKENLRLLCPNCNSQTSTFCGKRNKKYYYCEDCGKRKKSKKSKRCMKCEKLSQRKIVRPSKTQLLEEIKETNYCVVGRKYGISDNAIRKWLK